MSLVRSECLFISQLQACAMVRPLHFAHGFQYHKPSAIPCTVACCLFVATFCTSMQLWQAMHVTLQPGSPWTCHLGTSRSSASSYAASVLTSSTSEGYQLLFCVFTNTPPRARSTSTQPHVRRMAAVGTWAMGACACNWPDRLELHSVLVPACCACLQVQTCCLRTLAADPAQWE